MTGDRRVHGREAWVVGSDVADVEHCEAELDVGRLTVLVLLKVKLDAEDDGISLLGKDRLLLLGCRVAKAGVGKFYCPLAGTPWEHQWVSSLP